MISSYYPRCTVRESDNGDPRQGSPCPEGHASHGCAVVRAYPLSSERAGERMHWAALVIDDDPGIRQSLRLCLEVSGARVLGVATAEAALKTLDRGQFDVVFLDLWLGADSGLAALPDILRRQPGVGVVVVTAYASIESAVEAMRHGAVDYLPKPFSPDQVRLAAERVLRTQRLQREVAELQAQVQAAEGELTFETRSERFRAFMQTAARVAEADCVV